MYIFLAFLYRLVNQTILDIFQRTKWRGGPTLLDRFAATLSYNLVVEVMPLVSSLQGRASEDERDYRLHQGFVH